MKNTNGIVLERLAQVKAWAVDQERKHGPNPALESLKNLKMNEDEATWLLHLLFMAQEEKAYHEQPGYELDADDQARLERKVMIYKTAAAILIGLTDQDAGRKNKKKGEKA